MRNMALVVVVKAVPSFTLRRDWPRTAWGMMAGAAKAGTARAVVRRWRRFSMGGS